LLPEIGLGLKQANVECSPGDLRKILDRTRTISVVEEWAKRKPEAEDYKIARAAFIISTLIRGHYHDLAAKNNHQFVRHHPFRPSAILAPLADTAPYKLVPSNQVVQNLVAIIINGAFAEPNVSNRIALWSENVMKLREAFRCPDFEIQEVSNEDNAKDVAIDLAKKINLRTYDHRIESGLDIALAAALFVGPFYYIHDVLPAALIAVGGYLASQQTAFARSASQQVADRASRLRRLSELIPGRVITNADRQG
jgi:hypothetical protein